MPLPLNDIGVTGVKLIIILVLLVSKPKTGLFEPRFTLSSGNIADFILI